MINHKRRRMSVPIVSALSMLVATSVVLGGESRSFQDASEKRTFKTREFKDMPLVIREVRNLQSDTWYEDLEIEIKNTSTKPIYFLFAYLQFPDDPAPGDGVSGITLEFGKRANIHASRIAGFEDPHADPGQTIILTIREQYRRGLQFKQKKTPENMKKFELHFGVISFGDGTGFEVERFRDYRIKNPN